METRKESERAYFDTLYDRSSRRPSPLTRFYALAAGGARYEGAIVADCAGRDVLEYGCGEGGFAFTLAERGARVTGIDLSDTAIVRAREKAAQTPALSLSFEIGDAEELQFADRSFDRVCGSGILHHLDIERAARQVRRVLRAGGDAIFLEPVAYNPIGATFRFLTPNQHTPGEHPLVHSDFKILRNEFGAVRAEFYSLLSTAMIPALALPGGELVFKTAEAVDRVLLRTPGLRWLGGFVVVFLSQPRQ